ncbi:MAG: ABC transporter permease [Clostridium sp.]|nr:ABC transporter permease [Clostridium sp.]
MNLVIDAIEEGLLFSIVSMGVYITYKILDFPDLSVDGTYPLGAAIAAVILVNGGNPWLAIIIATAGGAIAGGITAFLHVKLKISSIMSGILVMISLYSVNLRVMGKSNIPLFNTKTIFNNTNLHSIFIILIIVIICKILIDIFLKTKRGLLLIAVGDNEQIVSSLGINKNTVKVLGLMISNGLVSMAGAIQAEKYGYADVTMGQGIIVMGLATVVIGITIFCELSFLKCTTICILGAIIYKLAIAIALNIDFNPNDLKLITAIIVIIALASNNGIFKFKNKERRQKKC